MENETCHELRAIEYKSKLLNPNSNDKPDPYKTATKIGTLQNMEEFLEKEKNFHTDVSWTKLNKKIRIDKILMFVDEYLKKNNIDEEEKESLIKVLTEALHKNKLQRVKDLIYDKKECIIKSIPILQYDKKSKEFSLKQQKKTTTTMSLAPKKHSTKKKIKRKEKASPKHTVKIKASPKGLFSQKNIKLSSKERGIGKGKTKHQVSPRAKV